MKKVLYIVFLTVFFLSCKGKKQPVTVSQELNKTETPGKKRLLPIEDVARFNSAEDLAAFYGKNVVKNGRALFNGDADERDYTILYENTPDEIIFTWRDGKIYDVAVANDGIWASKDGIRVGMPYENLVELNQGSIHVYGFGWDYGGAVDWNNGKLHDSGLQIFLAPEGEVPQKFLGDFIINPHKEELQALKLKVSAIVYVP